MTQLLFRNFQLLEPEVGELQGGFELLVEGDTVKESSDKPIKAPGADVIDCGGRTMMPGLIDSHVHVILSEVNIRYLESIPLTLMTARAARLMLGMINRGFTTRARHRRRRLGHQDRGGAGRHSGPAPVHRRCRDRADRRAQRSAPAHRFRHALPLLRRHAVRHAPVGRRVGSAQIRARADAPGRRPHQDHDVGRRRLALRSARQPAVQPGRGRRRRAGGDGVRPLRLRACLYAGSDDRARRMAACA